MRVVIQRVHCARVLIDRQVYSSIGKGLVVFVGIEKNDGDADINYLVDKIVNLRIFEDSEGKMNYSVLETQGELLVISQFTVMGDCRKGRRPSFSQAESHPRAKEVYERFVEMVKGKNVHVSTGEFQAIMNIEMANNGPVTIILDSKKVF